MCYLECRTDVHTGRFSVSADRCLTLLWLARNCRFIVITVVGVVASFISCSFVFWVNNSINLNLNECCGLGCMSRQVLVAWFPPAGYRRES